MFKIKIKETFFYYDEENEYLFIEIYFNILRWKKKVIRITARKDYILQILKEN